MSGSEEECFKICSGLLDMDSRSWRASALWLMRRSVTTSMKPLLPSRHVTVSPFDFSRCKDCGGGSVGSLGEFTGAHGR